MNISDFDNYMNSLSPELQEKVKTCKNINEMVELVASEGVELPDEALSIVSGGVGETSPCSEPQANSYMCCPSCKGSNGSIYSINSLYGHTLIGIATANSNANNYPISNYIIECRDCNMTFFAKSKNNIA